MTKTPSDPTTVDEQIDEIIIHSYVIDRCDLHEKYTSSCCGCQKARAVYNFLELTKEKTHEAIKALLEKEVRKARIDELAHMVCCDHWLSEVEEVTGLKNVDKSWETNVCHGDHYERIAQLSDKEESK